MFNFLLAVLAFGTMGAVLFLTWRSAERNASGLGRLTPKSTMASDGPDEWTGQ